MKEVTLYTDGACSGNPGRGGYGVILEYAGHEKEISAGYRMTTNNRMELMGVITGLEALKESCAVTLYSDSKYVVDAIRLGWAEGWRKNNWRRRGGKALNSDLWARLLAAKEKHSLSCVWVKGHAENEKNNRCDEMAVAAAAGKNLLRDTGYENESL